MCSGVLNSSPHDTKPCPQALIHLISTNTFRKPFGRTQHCLWAWFHILNLTDNTGKFPQKSCQCFTGIYYSCQICLHNVKWKMYTNYFKGIFNKMWFSRPFLFLIHIFLLAFFPKPLAVWLFAISFPDPLQWK